MKTIFLDTEFTDLTQNAMLISIALVDEDGKYFYAEVNDPKIEEVSSQFVKDTVLPARTLVLDTDPSSGSKAYEIEVNVRATRPTQGIPKETKICGTTDEIAEELTSWLERHEEEIQIWADCLAYDWVLFCELWGGALYVPRVVNYIPMDLCTVLEIRGYDPDISRDLLAGEPVLPKHNALADAIQLKDIFAKLF